ncbi:hypothetical protein HanHA300_Chr08g0280301 [Helianthus annuus]|nr:hypothetical protein HanHA300_Chr08g0280301 [Helianthus annuus]KAJ0553549.1 hypothetical protein HanHA89_Chr08g0297631 [Helianthus annuus]KAJ0719211.1 hypothetical protein HanLR1_Chr08g0279201 [Helianthus annuus]
MQNKHKGKWHKPKGIDSGFRRNLKVSLLCLILVTCQTKRPVIFSRSVLRSLSNCGARCQTVGTFHDTQQVW